MEKSLCLYFQVHQPDRLRLYRFFDIGNDSQYFDEFANRTILKRVAQRCYLPMNQILLDLIEKYNGEFKVTFSISGVALEQFAEYAPEVLESFKKLAKTKCVEFLAETYSHSLASLVSPKEFEKQVKEHAAAVKKHFGVKPTAFRNTELIYSDAIGAAVADMGYNVMLTEGAKHILGWKSPNFIYTNAINPKLKLLLKNFNLSDDIAFRFSDKGSANLPLTSACQGATNPKDASGDQCEVNATAPAMGAFLSFDVHENGFLYVFHKASSHKAYLASEESTLIAYDFAMYTGNAPWGNTLTYSMPADEDYYVLLGKNKLNLYADNEILQLKGDKRFNALKYVNLFHRFKNIASGDGNNDFLGI